MLLTVCEGETQDDDRIVEAGADDDYIEQRLRGLFGKEGDYGFVILADNELSFIQCHIDTFEGKNEENIILEYHDGSDDKHYICSDHLIGLYGLELIIMAFVDYLHSKEDWNSSFTWECDLTP